MELSATVVWAGMISLGLIFIWALFWKERPNAGYHHHFWLKFAVAVALVLLGMLGLVIRTDPMSLF